MLVIPRVFKDWNNNSVFTFLNSDLIDFTAEGDQLEGVHNVEEKKNDKNLPSQQAQTVKESSNRNTTQEVSNSSAKRNKRFL